MDRRIVPFRHWHYDWMANNAGEGPVAAHMTVEVLKAMESPSSWTAVVDGQPIASGGTVEQWPKRYLAWAYLSKDTAPHMRWVTREALRVLAAVQGRIEMDVRLDFQAGHRWAKMLGFYAETPVMKAYGPFGDDYTGYVRFN